MELKTNRKQAITLTVGNFKGGVGKTTNSILIAYTLAQKGIKTLVIDLDPQANATKTLTLTKLNQDEDGILTFEKTLMRGIADNKIDDLPIKIIDNLFLIPSNIDFEEFAKFLYQNTDNQTDEDFYFSKLLDPIKESFDIIIIDVPPMSKEITRNAVTSSDYVLISLQTQEHSLTGAENYIEELNKLNEKYDLNLTVVGLLPVLLKNTGTVDEYIIENAKEIFGESNIFSTIVPQMERIKRFDINGITNHDRHDLKVLQKYNEVTDELITRLNFYENEVN
ncbi:ParA family protein [Leuconostoc mesenteroides subsp. mesenteroides]|uniref:ParA family protein n=2 Tax=Leuconostoc mesenteroides TaxID=1245 RepID=UPI000E0982D9|nr:ParA family protein [Leuconostoc mesenteroides]RDF88338.1 ParA family protein [Leuconostoc mesenteroides subsp. mesenteroides]